MKPFNKPTLKLLKSTDEFIEEKLIPILKENEPTIKDLSFRFMIYYFTDILIY